jgi:hypothetical protein
VGRTPPRDPGSSLAARKQPPPPPHPLDPPLTVLLTLTGIRPPPRSQASGQYLFNFLYWNKKQLLDTARLRGGAAGGEQ